MGEGITSLQSLSSVVTVDTERNKQCSESPVSVCRTVLSSGVLVRFHVVCRWVL